MNPIIKWAGGKEKELPYIKENLPNKIERYIEPFVGGGAMLFHMLQKHPEIKRAVINDINPHLIKAYETIKNNPQELINRLADMEKRYYAQPNEDSKKSFFLEARHIFNDIIDITVNGYNSSYYPFNSSFLGLYLQLQNMESLEDENTDKIGFQFFKKRKIS